MRTRLLLLVLALLLPAPGWAGSWAFGCKFTTGTGTTAVRSDRFDISDYSVGCYRYANADSTHNFPLNPNGVLTPVVVTGQSALVCFDPDILDTATSAARLTPYHCPAGYIADVSNPLRSCMSIGELDGTEGDSATQDSCVRVGPGSYIFRANVACAASDTCQLTIRGEGM